MTPQRLQRVLAAAGFGSRRACEELILEGRVSVNGERVARLPVLVDPQRDEIAVDGRPVLAEKKVYFLLHKPKGVVCTNSDPSGRTRAVDLLRGVRERVFPVGRLDEDSMGLLLMTNDGELAQRLAHPRYGVPKTYRATCAGRVTPQTLERLRGGVWLSEGRTGPAEASVIHREPESTVLEVTLREGRNREVRRVLAKLGHPVRRLVRIAIGRLSLRGIPLGAFRPLRTEELAALKRALDRPIQPRPAVRPAPRPAVAAGRRARAPQSARAARDRRPARRRR